MTEAENSTILNIDAARRVFASVQATSPYDMAIGFALCDEVELLRQDARLLADRCALDKSLSPAERSFVEGVLRRVR